MLPILERQLHLGELESSVSSTRFSPTASSKVLCISNDWHTTNKEKNTWKFAVKDFCFPLQKLQRWNAFFNLYNRQYQPYLHQWIRVAFNFCVLWNWMSFQWVHPICISIVKNWWNLPCNRVWTSWQNSPVHLQVPMCQGGGQRQPVLQLQWPRLIPSWESGTRDQTASGSIGDIVWWSNKNWTYWHIIEGIWVSSLCNLSREYYLAAASCL